MIVVWAAFDCVCVRLSLCGQNNSNKLLMNVDDTLWIYIYSVGLVYVEVFRFGEKWVNDCCQGVQRSVHSS